MKWCFILLLGMVGSIYGEEHYREKRQSAVSPPRPGSINCPPADCPQDCGVQFFVDPQNGCRRCRCDPNDNSNPFVQPGILQCLQNPPCPEDCSTEVTFNGQTGCPECKCQDDDERPNQNCEARPRCRDAGGICKKTCGADEEQIRGRRACKGRTCKCCIKKSPPQCPAKPPCPADCATNITVNPLTGCSECRCQGVTVRPPRPVTLGPVCSPNPPCPADCATTFITDPQSGCRRCTCRPSTGNPFPRPVCNPRPPCPADCATTFIRDPQTGCRKCTCRPPTINVGTCTPGQTWKQECNSCFCSPNGTPACTEKACVGPVCNPKPPCPQDCATTFIRDPQTGCQNCICRPSTINVGTCTPGQQWTQECNSCFCSPNGTPSCTQKACVGPVCNPNPPCPADCATTFITDPQTGCRKCTCRPSTGNPFSKPVCAANPPCPADCATTFILDPQTGCRKCICRPSTGNPLTTNVDTCTPGQTWTQKCNSCFCSANGTPACTLKACDVCLPVACPGGCISETDPTTGCPKCTCPPSLAQPTSPSTTCTPVTCPLGCFTATNLSTGCPGCKCRPSTTQPIVPPPDRCPQNPPCPADCATEFIRNPQNGCVACRCRTDITQINPFATLPPPPSINACRPAQCPADCTTEFIRNPQTGCNTCRCRTDIAQINPFAPPLTINACPPTACPADCATDFIRNPQTGCNTCRCRTDITQINPFAPPPSINACPPVRCPADCAPEISIDPRTGCQTCRCRTGANVNNPIATLNNPFAG